MTFDDTPLVIGLISDTHGLVRPDVKRVFAGVSHILHAGDVGGAGVLAALGAIAPVAAVFGNTDAFDETRLPASLDLELGGLRVHVSHGHELGSPTPVGLVARYDADVIVFGHTHQPLVERIGRQVVVNPGAAGPARFRLVPSVAKLTIAGGEVGVEHLALVR